jgi:hypothetical protein
MLRRQQQAKLSSGSHAWCWRSISWHLGSGLQRSNRSPFTARKRALYAGLSMLGLVSDAEIPACRRGGTCSPLVMVRNRSWPAVSQICSLIHLLSSRIFLILKSILQATKEQPFAACVQAAAVHVLRPRYLSQGYLPDCGDEARRERVLRKPQQQARLAHTCTGWSPNIDQGKAVHRSRPCSPACRCE